MLRSSSMTSSARDASRVRSHFIEDGPALIGGTCRTRPHIKLKIETMLGNSKTTKYRRRAVTIIEILMVAIILSFIVGGTMRLYNVGQYQQLQARMYSSGRCVLRSPQRSRSTGCCAT